ncbi:hypothetical protein RJT34_01704 [Clitoria ternatea]|uniref:MYND-type domain-containing protein n=1 Tax=Clitoria ternatea TaxID=43366 RepID=A0AAN9KJL2_CLITE
MSLEGTSGVEEEEVVWQRGKECDEGKSGDSDLDMTIQTLSHHHEPAPTAPTPHELSHCVNGLQSHNGRCEGISNEYQDEVKWSLETFVGEGVSRDNDVNNFHGCEMCGSRSTARCSRCKVVKYCSLKCLIMNWRWHKDRCFAWDVGVTENSHKKEETVHSSAPLSLEFNSEGTTDHKFSVKVPQETLRRSLESAARKT